ncbi:chaperonin 10-like protein [Halenospora varia]|nr:chaperonin 10-like protein [Halenospora varia]
MSNQGAWINSKGEAPKLAPADIPSPGPGQLVIENHAVPLHPGDWKLAKGIIPIPLKYPAILGNYVAGFVHDIGKGVTRFKKGDRVLSMSAQAVRNDHRFGAHQRFTLSIETFTVHIGETHFEEATSASIVYAAMSALVLHLNLERPSKDVLLKDEKVLIWGGGSSIGFYAVQIAAQAGYKVITTASDRAKASLEAAGAAKVLDYHSTTIFDDLLKFGPYKAIFGASESAADQVVIGKLLAAQGGGKFLSTMGVRPGVVLPEGVTGFFVQYMDDYLKSENVEYTKWVFWEYLEGGLVSGSLKLGDVEVLGGLSKLAEGLRKLEAGEVRDKKLVIKPNLEE